MNDIYDLLATLRNANESSSTNEHDDQKCEHCGSEQFIFLPEDCVRYCTRCFTQENYQTLTDPRCRERVRTDRQHSARYKAHRAVYDRSNHLRGHLTRAQGLENVVIPETVIQECRIRKYTSPSEVRRFLKLTKRSHLNKHANLIVHQVTGAPVMTIDRDLEGQIEAMFDEFHTLYAANCGPRKNCLSYSYLIRRILSLLGRNDLSKHFADVKSKDKALQQQVIFDRIAKKLGWIM